MKGSDFKQDLVKSGASGDRREEKILETLKKKANLPSFMWKWKRIEIVDLDNDLSVSFQIMPDYLCIGADDDFIRVSMRPSTAQLIADHYGCTLPTRKMVDTIYASAKKYYFVDPGGSDQQKQSTPWMKKHDDLVEKFNRENYKVTYKPGELISGHKKNIILAKEISAKNVVIYGGHMKDGGKRVQNKHTTHGWYYADYSHGVRLIKNDFRVTLPDATKNWKLEWALQKKTEVSQLLNYDDERDEDGNDITKVKYPIRRKS